MKRIFITALFFPLYLSITVGDSKTMPIEELIKKDKYERFVNAITWIESRHNPLAIGMANDVGMFQITPVRLADYNQHTGSNYVLFDCFDVRISRMIFDYYSANLPFEVAARRWNGGPRGMSIEATAYYWDLVRKQL